jgi:hypothetical protein
MELQIGLPGLLAGPGSTPTTLSPQTPTDALGSDPRAETSVERQLV